MSNNTTANSSLSSYFLVDIDDTDGNGPFTPSEIYVSNEMREAWEIAIDLCLSFVVANIGVISNIIIITVFAKQGYNESMNISMTAIAIWDLIKCIGGSMQRMSGPLSLISLAATESWTNIMTVVMNYLISFATYVSSVLAAYVAVERCLCVSLPLLVKILLTPRTTFIAMTSMSVIVFGCFAVLFAIYDIVWVYSPQWNATIAVYRYNEFFKKHEGPLMRYYNLSGVIWPTISFGVITICTFIIVYQLRKASKFRTKNKVTEKATISTRDKQVVKMLVVIIAIYVINLSPRVALYMAKYFISELYFLRKFLAKDEGLDFNRAWNEYVNGFFEDDQNMWIGLRAAHILQKAEFRKLYIAITFSDGNACAGYEDFSGYSFYGEYINSFRNGNPPSGISVGDCLSSLQGVPFSTWDRDQDGSVGENYASLAGSGWWYKGGNCDIPCNLLGWGLDNYDATPPHQKRTFLGFDVALDPSLVLGVLSYLKHS